MSKDPEAEENAITRGEGGGGGGDANLSDAIKVSNCFNSGQPSVSRIGSTAQSCGSRGDSQGSSKGGSHSSSGGNICAGKERMSSAGSVGSGSNAGVAGGGGAILWDFAILIDLEEITYLHCHQGQKASTLVLVGQDGVQRPPILFPNGKFSVLRSVLRSPFSV